VTSDISAAGIFRGLEVDIYRKEWICDSGTQMEYIKIPETIRISGTEAIQSLNEYISELQQQTNKELTKKQKSAMIKFARGLIASIENEIETEAMRKETGKTNIIRQIKEAILKGISGFRSAADEDVGSTHPQSPRRLTR
jgi:hypothetical protein